MADSLPPLTWENSANNQPESSPTLPLAVESCLQNAKYLHLGTASRDFEPHVSLMNYTYFDATEPSKHPNWYTVLPKGPFIIMTTNSASKKTRNLHANNKVSLLVHDWVSARPPTANGRASPPPFSSAPAGAPSGLAALLMDMNSAEMGKISATMTGTATLLARGSEVEMWCKRMHLRYNGLSDSTKTAWNPSATAPNGTSSLTQLSGSPTNSFHDGPIAKDDDVRVVVVRIEGGSIADWKGGVKEFIVTGGSPA